MKKPSRIVAGGLVLAALAAAYILHVRKDMSDFGVGYRSAGRFLAGETVYRASDGHLQYKYAPVSALFYAPLSLLSWEAAKACWYVLQIVLLAGCFWQAGRLLEVGRKRSWFVLGLSFLILAKYVGREVELGQVNLLIIALLLAMTGSLVKGRDLAAGLLWAASLFFKPYAIIFLPYFILKKKWKSLTFGFGGLVVGLAAPVVVFGWEGNLVVLGEWIRSLSKSTPGLLAIGDNASLFAFFYKILGIGKESLAAVLFLVGTAFLAAVFLLMLSRGGGLAGRAPEVLESAFLMTLIPMLSPLGWNYNYLYGLLAVAGILASFDRFPPAGRWVLAADFVLIGASLREVLGRAVFSFYTFHALAAISFLIVLAGLGYLRRAEIA